MLVVLIEGSKIWDDPSLENNSFSKVIKPYTTLEINRLEKYLLAFIDYTLTIDQKEYSQSYFELRRHVNLFLTHVRNVDVLYINNHALYLSVL